MNFFLSFLTFFQYNILLVTPSRLKHSGDIDSARADAAQQNAQKQPGGDELRNEDYERRKIRTTYGRHSQNGRHYPYA